MSLCLCTDNPFIIVVFEEGLGSEKEKVSESLGLFLFVCFFSFFYLLFFYFVGASLVVRASLVAHIVKNLLAMQETQVQYLGQEDPLEKGMATHSTIIAWRIPWTEEPGGLQSTGSQRVGHD